MTSIQKFTINDFEELDTADLLINIWSYSECLEMKENNKMCEFCNIYREYCYQILRRRWQPEWGKYNKVMSKLSKNDENFINVGSYSSAQKHLIFNELMKKNNL